MSQGSKDPSTWGIHLQIRDASVVFRRSSQIFAAMRRVENAEISLERERLSFFRDFIFRDCHSGASDHTVFEQAPV